MRIKVAYNDNSEEFLNNLKELLINYPLIKLESFHENLFKERKKAFKLKGIYGTKLTPFAVLINKEDKVIEAFYSDNNGCTIDSIRNVLNKFYPYDKRVQ